MFYSCLWLCEHVNINLWYDYRWYWNESDWHLILFLHNLSKTNFVCGNYFSVIKRWCYMSCDNVADLEIPLQIRKNDLICKNVHGNYFSLTKHYCNANTIMFLLVTLDLLGSFFILLFPLVSFGCFSSIWFLLVLFGSF